MHSVLMYRVHFHLIEQIIEGYNMKKYLKLVCILFTIISLVGCGKNDEGTAEVIESTSLAEEISETCEVTGSIETPETDEAVIEVSETPYIIGDKRVDQALVDMFVPYYDLAEQCDLSDQFLVVDEAFYEYIEQDDGYRLKIKNLDSTSDRRNIVVIPEEYNGKPIVEYNSPDEGYVDIVVMPDTDNLIYMRDSRHTLWACYRGNLFDYSFATQCTTYECMPNFDVHGLVIKDDKLIAVHPDAVSMGDTLAEIVVPECVVEINRTAFRCVHSNFKLVLPNTLKVIGTAAFENTLPTEIVLPDGLEVIENFAFRGAILLENTNLVIPDSVKEIGLSAFDGANITSLSIGRGISIIDEVFGGSQLEGELFIPGNVKTLRGFAFSVSNIEKVVFEEGFERLEHGAFYNCEKLTDVVLPDSLQYIELGAFDGCTALTELTIPDNARVVLTNGEDTYEFAPDLVFNYRGKTYTASIEDRKALAEASERN